jgi:hypothetical protein
MKTIRLRVLENVRTTDALLTPATEAELAASARSNGRVDLGRVWDGIEASLEGLEPEDCEKILDRFDVYREMKKKPNGTKDHESHADFNKRLAAGDAMNISAMNAANRAFWVKRLDR